jgi:hypothetical protein
MAKLSDEQRKQLEELQALADAPDEPSGPSHSRVENINVTIDLDNDVQVRRAVKSGLLPASFLEDDDDDGDGDDDDGDDDTSRAKKDDAPRRRLDGRYT